MKCSGWSLEELCFMLKFSAHLKLFKNQLQKVTSNNTTFLPFLNYDLPSFPSHSSGKVSVLTKNPTNQTTILPGDMCTDNCDLQEMPEARPLTDRSKQSAKGPAHKTNGQVSSVKWPPPSLRTPVNHRSHGVIRKRPWMLVVKERSGS